MYFYNSSNIRGFIILFLLPYCLLGNNIGEFTHQRNSANSANKRLKFEDITSDDQNGKYVKLSTRERIKKTQLFLSSKGHYKGPADGIFGPQLTNALKKYQKVNGLPETGHLSMETWNFVDQHNDAVNVKQGKIE